MPLTSTQSWKRPAQLKLLFTIFHPNSSAWKPFVDKIRLGSVRLFIARVHPRGVLIRILPPVSARAQYPARSHDCLAVKAECVKVQLICCEDHCRGVFCVLVLLRKTNHSKCRLLRTRLNLPMRAFSALWEHQRQSFSAVSKTCLCTHVFYRFTVRDSFSNLSSVALVLP